MLSSNQNLKLIYHSNKSSMTSLKFKTVILNLTPSFKNIGLRENDVEVVLQRKCPFLKKLNSS